MLSYVSSINRISYQYPSKIAQGFAAYEANTGLAHPNYKASAVQRRQTSGSAETASLPLTDDSDELWEGEISVGTPPVKFRSTNVNFIAYLLHKPHCSYS